MIQLDYDLVIFDGDGTLRRATVANQACPHRAGEWELIAGVQEHLVTIAREHVGVKFGLASNQAGIAFGHLTYKTALDLLCDMAQEAFGFVPPIELIQICPHAPNDRCKCRKPYPAMIEQIVRVSGVSKERTLFVGDLDSDKQAAMHAGIRFQWAWEFFGKSGMEWVDWLARRAEEDSARAHHGS